MPKGASPKREREYQELEHKFEEEGRYPGREEEVAARIVNRQRAEAGESADRKPKESNTLKPRRGTGHRRANTTRAARRSKPS